MNSKSKYGKVLILGIDGMDPKITSTLLSQGKLPNFKRLSEKGSYISLETSNPPHSPVAWTTIATGKNPGKHNIFDFIRRNPNNYLPELSLSRSLSGIAGSDYQTYIKADPFWRITSNNQVPTSIIRWPVTFPPEKVEGRMLSGLGVPDIKGFLSGYTFYTAKKQGGDQVKTSNKIIEVNQASKIETIVLGPKTKKGNDIVDIISPLTVQLRKDTAELEVSGKKYSVSLNSWSEWIRVEFKSGFFQKVSGIFKAFLVSIDPFEMYITTVQFDPENPLTNISYPHDYSSRLAKSIGTYHTLGMPEETDGFVDGRISKEAFLKQAESIEGERDKMFWKEFSKFKEIEMGVLAFVYDTGDRIQHVFWKGKSVSQEIVEYYQSKDSFLGRLIEQIDKDTLLLIISDHGFSSFKTAVSMNTWLVENDLMTLTEEIQEGEGALFQHVDWGKTKAYSLGFNSIYINLKGRENKGIVEEKNKIVDDIIKKLANLKYKGKKVIHQIYKSEDIYNGEWVGEAPDIIVGFNPGFRMSWETAIGGFTKEVLKDNKKKWSGDHLVDPKFVPGVLFSNASISGNHASQEDIVPTVLDAIGLEVPKDMDGKSLLK